MCPLSLKEKCRVCGRPPVITRPYSGEVLCETCFRASILKKIRETISKYKMLQRTDRIAVAVSGGKDSIVLLSTLVEIQSRFPQSKIIAITLEEGTSEDARRRKILDQITQQLDVEYVVSSYRDLFSVTLDEIAEHAQDLHSSLSVCAYCGVLRRQGLNILARNINADKLALGHNLDDELQSMLMNLIRGDLQRLARSTPVQQGIKGWLIPRIKPLYHILEQELALFAQYLKWPVIQSRCPYAPQSLRTEIRDWLTSFEKQHPGSKFNLAATLGKIITMLQRQPLDTFQKCELCNEPTSRKVCIVCEYRQSLGLL